jgi:hypothetical protein
VLRVVLAGGRALVANFREITCARACSRVCATAASLHCLADAEQMQEGGTRDSIQQPAELRNKMKVSMRNVGGDL